MYEPVLVLMLELVGLVRLVGLARWSGERELCEMGPGGGEEMLAADTELTRLEYESNAAMGGCRG